MKIFSRILLLLLTFSGSAGWAVADPQVVGPAKVELISEINQIVPGQTFYLALNFEMEAHWHIYWKNPGASGLPVEIEWKLPEGFVAGDVKWPAPEQIELGGLINYGYEDSVTLMVPIKAPETLAPGLKLSFEASAFWLICKEVCLPGDASLTLELTTGGESSKSVKAPMFEAARKRFPEVTLPWQVLAVVKDKALFFSVKQTDIGVPLTDELYFYADEEGVVDPNAEQVYRFTDEKSAELIVPLALEQLNQPLEVFAGVLQSADGSWQVQGTVGLESGINDDVSVVIIDTAAGGFEGFLLRVGLAGWLLLGFIGGLILNLMPCVLPVLSLKVFSLLKHSGQSRAQALLHGGAYAIGVIASFLALAGTLLLIRSFGQQIGWGFQLQSPGFVAALTVLVFLFALNLMGVFEIGSSLIGVDAKVSKRHDVLGSFGMGIFAAVVGAPCIGPFLAPVSGIALQADPATCLLIFGFMGFGLASPFLLLSVFPKLSAYLPKPGAWMESLKQFMGFLLMATAVFLVYVMGTLGGEDAIISLLSALLITAIAAWIYGRWSVPVKARRTQRIAQVVSYVFLFSALFYAVSEAKKAHHHFISDSSTTLDEDWTAWSKEGVETALANGQAVFVDFTASWCLICQVNKKVALHTEATQSLFEDYGIFAMEADWTRYDPEITKELERFGRSGVPLYVLYAPNGSVKILPQNLTNRKIREAVEKALD